MKAYPGIWMPIYLAFAIICSQVVLISAFGWLASAMLVTTLIYAWRWPYALLGLGIATGIVSAVIALTGASVLNVLHSALWYLGLVALMAIMVLRTQNLGVTLQWIASTLVVLCCLLYPFGLFNEALWHKVVWQDSSVAGALKVLESREITMLPFEVLVGWLARNWAVFYFAVGMLGWFIGYRWFLYQGSLGHLTKKTALTHAIANAYLTRPFVIGAAIFLLSGYLFSGRLSPEGYYLWLATSRIVLLAMSVTALIVIYRRFKSYRHGAWLIGILGVFALLMPTILWYLLAVISGIDAWYHLAKRN